MVSGCEAEDLDKLGLGSEEGLAFSHCFPTWVGTLLERGVSPVDLELWGQIPWWSEGGPV